MPSIRTAVVNAGTHQTHSCDRYGSILVLPQYGKASIEYQQAHDINNVASRANVQL